jgi:2-oxoisovalerate dehydrogenase E2 component (dihydrolipoyl transacylase)
MSEYVFKLPDLGEGTVESEIGEWLIKVGDQVTEEDIVGTMMTDKAAVELSSPISGKVVKLAGEPGDIIAVGAALVVFDVDGDVGAASPNGAAPRVAAQAAPTEAAPRQKGRVPTSPAVRRRAKEAGIDLHAVPGSGSGGRVTRNDFEAYIAGAPVAAKAVPATAAPAATRPDTKEIKVIGLRRIIAERMATAAQEIPSISLNSRRCASTSIARSLIRASG